MVTSYDCYNGQAITFCLTFPNLISPANDFCSLSFLTFHDFSHTDNNFLVQEGNFMAGVQKPDGYHHGGVAVPVAVLIVGRLT